MRIADMPEFQNRTQVLTCGPDDTVYDAVVSMTYKHCGAVAITIKDKLVGVFVGCENEVVGFAVLWVDEEVGEDEVVGAVEVEV